MLKIGKSKLNSEYNYPCGCYVGYSSMYDKDKVKQKLDNNEFNIEIAIQVNDFNLCKEHRELMTNKVMKFVESNGPKWSL